MDLTGFEREAVDAWRQGRPFIANDGNIPENRKPEVRLRSEILRLFVLERLSEDLAGASAGALTLRGAWIDGRLDLQDARNLQGGAVCAIILENCLIPDPMVLSEGHFGRLSLMGSRIHSLEAQHARFDGAVNLSLVRSAEEEGSCTGCDRDGVAKGACGVNLTGAHIDGDLTARDAIFCAPPEDTEVDYSAGGRPYAVVLRNGEVTGDIIFQPGFRAIGGVMLGASIIGGSLYMQGAHLCAEAGHALDMSRVKIAGSILLSGLFRPGHPATPFRAEGSIRLYGAHVAGELYMAGAKLALSERGDPSNRDTAVMAFMAYIQQRVRMTAAYDERRKEASIRFESAGRLVFIGAVLGGLELSGVSLSMPGVSDLALDMTEATIRGAFSIQNLLVLGPDGQDLTLDSVIKGRLEAARMRVEGVFSLINTQLEHSGPETSCNLHSANIGGECRILGTRIHGNEGAASLSIEEGSIDGWLSIGDCSFQGQVRLLLCKVKSVLSLDSLTIEARGTTAMAANGVEVAGNLQLGIQANGHVFLGMAIVKGRLVVNQLALTGMPHLMPHLYLEGASLGGVTIAKTGNGNLPALEARATLPSDQLGSMRQLNLACYPGWKLVEARSARDAAAVFAMLWDGARQVVPLTGASAPIHVLNQKRRPRLNRSTVHEYLKLFCHFVWGEDGAFHIVDRREDLEAAGLDPAAHHAELSLETEKAGAEWRVRAIVFYASHFFSAVFRIQRSGMVIMENDLLLNHPSSGPVRLPSAQEYRTPFRRLREEPSRHAEPGTSGGATAEGEAIGAAIEAWPLHPAIAGAWTEVAEASAKRVRSGLQRYYDDNLKITVNLVAVNTGFLDDSGGENWGQRVHLNMQGFAYGQLDSADPPPTLVEQLIGPPRQGLQKWELRRTWLQLQRPIAAKWRTPDEFDSEQHARVARIYRSAGRMNDAREIVSDQLRVEGNLKAVASMRRYWKQSLAAGTAGMLLLYVASVPPILSVLGGLGLFALLLFGPFALHRLYGLTAGYGLRPLNAIATFLVLLIIGWVGVLAANRDVLAMPAVQIFGVETSPVVLADFRDREQILYAETSLGRDVVEEPYPPRSTPMPSGALRSLGLLGGRSATPIACGELIEPFLYAADIFIPLLDLRQEMRCSPRESATAWQWAKAIYAVLGWIVTSLTILTITGVLRERLEK